ncbi:MAG: FMN-binding negative transcriptional regulator [Bdellovibrionota bacterium]
MYNPKHFQISDLEKHLSFINRHPLGLLVSHNATQIQTSYLPFVIEHKDDTLYLLTHVARANPQWRTIEKDKFFISFRGPDCYISPSIYKSALQVPTWNYTAIECRGEICEITDSPVALDALMKKSVAHFEKQNETTWSYDLPEDFRKQMFKAIVGLRFKISAVEAKFKLSQNRDPQDHTAVKEFLQSSTAPFAKEMLRWF